MATDAEIRRRKKQDATRNRVGIWLSPSEAATLDEYKQKWELPSRLAAIRKLLGIEESAPTESS